MKGDKAGGSDRAAALLTYTVSSENKNAHLYLTGREADKVSVRFRLESGVKICELVITGGSQQLSSNLSLYNLKST